MDLVFLTNMENSYQRALAEALYAELGGGFRMICCEPIDRERAALGWRAGADAPWLLNAWRSPKEMREAARLVEEASVAVRGAAPLQMVEGRIHAGKLTFTYCERPFKPSRYLRMPIVYAGAVAQLWPLDRANHHLLATGAFCGPDFGWLRLFRGRSWRWGYFPEVADVPPQRRPGDRIRLLWAGRMLKWKRLDLLLEAARRLVRDGLDFELELIGDGEAREALVDACAADPLGSRVRFHPPTTPENVHAAMARADVYVFPSSREEGWGVVVNEAMAAGCCVVASDAAGAPPWLIEHGETGVLFKSGSATDLTRALAMVIRWTAVRREVMGRRAWESMASTWSPRVAAQRLVALAERLGGPGAPPDFGAGPCSRCG